MYAIGETFYHEIFEEEHELNVVGDIMLGGHEYIVAEGFDGVKYAFVYDENEEEIQHIEEESDAEEVLEFWETEYNGAATADIGDWDGDGYYDREDSKVEATPYSEVDNMADYDEDVDSFITGLMD